MNRAKAMRHGFLCIAGLNDQPLKVPPLPIFRLRPLFDLGVSDAVTFGIILERHGTLGPLNLVDLIFKPGCAFFICPLLAGKDYSVIREVSVQGDHCQVMIEALLIDHEHFKMPGYTYHGHYHGHFVLYSGNPNLIQVDRGSTEEDDGSED